MSNASRFRSVLLGPAPRGTNVPGLILGLLWLGFLAFGAFLYFTDPATLSTPTPSANDLGISAAISAIQQRVWAYVLIGFATVGLMIQLGAESVLWHLNRR